MSDTKVIGHVSVIFSKILTSPESRDFSLSVFLLEIEIFKCISGFVLLRPGSNRIDEKGLHHQNW